MLRLGTFLRQAKGATPAAKPAAGGAAATPAAATPAAAGGGGGVVAFIEPIRRGFGRNNKIRSKAGDNNPYYDRGPVEWIPRPVRLTYSTIDQVREWMIRETLDGKTAEFNNIRDLHRQWSQHPKRPVLGDVEPRFPKQVYKQAHRIRQKFLYRWHKANSPDHWMWMPKEPGALHRKTGADYPENWQALAAAQNPRRM